MQIYEDRNACSHIYRQEIIPLVLGRLPATRLRDILGSKG
jgi:hypothetical protein